MTKFDFIKRGLITIEIQSLSPENFVNILWREGVRIKNATRLSRAHWVMDVDPLDYSKVKKLSKNYKIKIKILKTKGIISYLIMIKSKASLFIGGMIFLVLIYGYSLFIWDIDIETDKYVSPYEVRQHLSLEGIKPGMLKSRINVYDIEKRLMELDSRIMWARVRFEGSHFKIKIEERQNPPKLSQEEISGDMIAKMDGEILRVYTTSGTAAVEKGDIVKAGDVVIKSVQGKEGNTYETKAEGEVIAKTFYEDEEEILLRGVKRERTGNKAKSIYIELFGKKLYLKKGEDKFEKYDKIEESGKILKKTSYYEVKENNFELSEEEIIYKKSNEMEENIKKNLDKSSKVLDKIINKSIEGDTLTIKVVFVVEQNIAEKPTN
ncbi:sporulation protein YqfD [Clostridium sp.]|uniref:sporulation protein YqfD n=1 Tax=Clostridium sp. TaxID=1506 RepID=UPI0034644F3C